MLALALLAAAVVAVPGLGPAELDPGLRAGVALLVPDAGPTTSRERALATLERGAVRNSIHGELPPGPALVAVEVAEEPPAEGVVAGVPPRAGANDRRYVLVDHAHGEPGLLVSDSTRIPGLVSAADVAERRYRFEPRADAVAYVRDLDARIRDNGVARMPAAAAALLAILVLAVVRPRAAVLAFATAALANLVLGAAGVSAPWLTVPAIALGALAAWPLARVLRTPLSVGAVLAGTVAAYGAAMALDARWVALSPLGPTQNARFFGLSNLLATMLLVPALAGAAALWRARGWAPFLAVAAVAVVTVGSSRLGADGGGALVFASALAVLAAALAGWSRRALALAAAGAVAAVAALAADALLGPATHVGRSVRGGPGEVLADVGDRLVLSWERATAGPVHVLAIAAALALVAVLLARGALDPLPLAAAAALGVSLLVNDSPLEVAVGGAAAVLALARAAGLEEARRYNPP